MFSRTLWLAAAAALLSTTAIASDTEIKSALSARPTKGFYNALKDIQPDKTFVVHAGDERYPVSEGVEAIGVAEMAQMLYAKPR